MKEQFIFNNIIRLADKINLIFHIKPVCIKVTYLLYLAKYNMYLAKYSIPRFTWCIARL